MSDFGTLDPGERVLWSGRPNPLRYAVRKAAPLIGGLIFFGFLAGLLLFLFSRSNVKADALVFVLLLPLFGLAYVVSLLWHFWRGMHATYVLTDRRVIINITDIFPRRISVLLGHIHRIDARPHGSGSGDIYFKEIFVDGTEGSAIQREGFFGITDFVRVERLLRTAIYDADAHFDRRIPAQDGGGR